MSEREAIEQYDIRNRDPISYFGYGEVVVFDGSVVLDAKLAATWYEDAFAAAGINHSKQALIIVDGDLTAHGTIAMWGEPSVNLYVTGNLRCDVLDGTYHQNILIDKDADVRCLIIATYPDAALAVRGATRVPYALTNDDHAVELDLADGCRLLQYAVPEDLRPVFDERGIDFDPDDEEPHYTLAEWLRQHG